MTEEGYVLDDKHFTVVFDKVNDGYAVIIAQPGKEYLTCIDPITVEDEELVQRIKNICGALQTVLNETIKKRRKEQ